MAILCVTLNPCLDKTLTVPAWAPGDMVRGTAVRAVVGGKGNNVARALAGLGHSRDAIRPATFLGGAVGEECARRLRQDDGFAPLIVPTRAPTRVILTVRTGDSAEQTSFFDPDPAIEADEAAALLAQVTTLLAAGHVTALTLSGSSPAPATHGSYGALIMAARSAGVPVFLDTYGAALRGLAGRLPDVIQLNRREAGLFLGVERPDDRAIAGLLERWSVDGVAAALVTNGPGAVLARVGGRSFRVQPPTVAVVNPVGSGDSVLAGLVDAWDRRPSNPEGWLRHGVACGVANALRWDAGQVEPGLVRALVPEVEVVPW